MRDLCRARADLVDDRDRARKRLGAFLLRHARVFRGGSYWTVKHDQWLTAQRFDERALGETFGHYRAVLTARDAALAAVEADLKPWFDREPFVDCVHRLGAYRGIAHLGALTFASEVCDWRRFPRAGAFMGFTGLVPSEYSSGGSTRRGHQTLCRQSPPAHPAGRIRMGLPAPPGGRRPVASPPAGPGPAGDHPRVEGPDTPVRPLPAHGTGQEHQVGRGRRDRP